MLITKEYKRVVKIRTLPIVKPNTDQITLSSLHAHVDGTIKCNVNCCHCIKLGHMSKHHRAPERQRNSYRRSCGAAQTRKRRKWNKMTKSAANGTFSYMQETKTRSK